MHENKATYLKVLSYNIHKGFSSGNQNLVLDQIRDAIRSINPDMVFLQEVQGIHHEKAEQFGKEFIEAQFEYLADSVFSHFAYGKNAVYSEGHHGNAILSKYPFSSWDNIDLNSNRLEQRGLLHSVVEIPGRKQKIHLMCTHFSLFEKNRFRQIHILCDRIRETVEPNASILICGDFNDWRERIGGILHKELAIQDAYYELNGHHARSYPSFLPFFRLDRIYYKGMTPQTASCLSGYPWSKLSDHLALYAEFLLPIENG